jgi:hypothetical protein
MTLSSILQVGSDTVPKIGIISAVMTDGTIRFFSVPDPRQAGSDPVFGKPIFRRCLPRINNPDDDISSHSSCGSSSDIGGGRRCGYESGLGVIKHASGRPEQR